jgi:hypothetical protein
MVVDGISNLGRADLSPGLSRKGVRPQIRVTENSDGCRSLSDT